MLVLGGVNHMVMQVAKIVTQNGSPLHQRPRTQSHVIESRCVTGLNIMFGPTCISLDRGCADLLRAHPHFQGHTSCCLPKYAAERDGA